MRRSRRSLKRVDYTAERIQLDPTRSYSYIKPKSKAQSTSTDSKPPQPTGQHQLIPNNVPADGDVSDEENSHDTDVDDDDDVFKHGSEVISQSKGFKINPEIKVSEEDVGKHNDCASVPGAIAVYDVRLNGRGPYYKALVYEKGKDFVFELDLDYFKKHVFDVESDDFINYKSTTRDKPWRKSKSDSVAGRLLDKLYLEEKMSKHYVVCGNGNRRQNKTILWYNFACKKAECGVVTIGMNASGHSLVPRKNRKQSIIRLVWRRDELLLAVESGSKTISTQVEFITDENGCGKCCHLGYISQTEDTNQYTISPTASYHYPKRWKGVDAMGTNLSQWNYEDVAMEQICWKRSRID
eukprot:448703_1